MGSLFSSPTESKEPNKQAINIVVEEVPHSTTVRNLVSPN